MAGIKIGGLASGMDIDSIVSQLMTAERVPLDKLNQKKTFTEWQRDDYRQMKTLLFDFDQLIFNGVSRQSSYIKKTVSSSNSEAVTIKNISSTVDFSGSLEVHSLASAATMYSTASTGIDSTKTLSESGIAAPQTITIKTIKSDGTIQTDAEAYKLDLTSTDTLDSIIAKINKDSGVTAFFDSSTKKVSLIAKNTGDVSGGAEIVLSSTGDFFTKLNLTSDNVAANGNVPPVGTLGTNADFTYNGLRTSRTTNTFRINGVEFSLKQQTTTAVTFSSSPDVDSILDTITKFVDKYNEIIEKVKSKTSETKYRDFTPLTTEQKKDMSEDEIKLWEEKAKSGTLRNDSILSNGLNRMRTNISNAISGVTGYTQLAQIGIKTTSNYLDGGKLVIDETKLREAIASNPNSVYELFQTSGTTTETKGIAQRLRDSLKTTMTEIETKAGKASSINNTFTLGRLLNNFNDQITRFEDRLSAIENRYWSRFTAMEKAIQQSNSQSGYISQMFS